MAAYIVRGCLETGRIYRVKSSLDWVGDPEDFAHSRIAATRRFDQMKEDRIRALRAEIGRLEGLSPQIVEGDL